MGYICKNIAKDFIMINIEILKLMLDTYVIPMPNDDTFPNRLLTIDKSSPIEDLDEIIESCHGKIVSFPPARTDIINQPISAIDLADTIAKYNSYRENTFKPDNSFIYVKLETGGFTGYDSQSGKLGEAIFPILRVTINYDGHIFDRYINPNGAEATIRESTKQYLEKRNVLTNALASPYNIVDVNNEIRDWFRGLHLKAHNPGLNRQIFIVSANSDFNQKFINKQLPELRKVAGIRQVDINTIVWTMEANGQSIVPLTVYSDDPELYLSKMIEIHKMLLEVV